MAVEREVIKNYEGFLQQLLTEIPFSDREAKNLATASRIYNMKAESEEVLLAAKFNMHLHAMRDVLAPTRQRFYNQMIANFYKSK